MIRFLLVLGLFFVSLGSKAGPTDIIFWHSMAGHDGREVQRIVDDFNRNQKKYRVILVFKGDYTETFTSFAAAFRAHHPPAIVQIFEAGTALISNPPGVIKPVGELMKEQHIKLHQEDFLPQAMQFYSRDEQLLALPFNLSIPIVYFNRDVLEKEGYPNGTYPKTYQEMEVLAQQLVQKGYDCAFTSNYPGWILFESFLAIHDIPYVKTNPLQIAYNSPKLLSHIQRLKRWHDLHYFKYAGRVDDAMVLFTSGLCPIMSQSSGSYNSLKKNVDFPLGIASMPFDPLISAKRHANVMGGAALWVVSGQSNEVYQGVAQFLAFIAAPSIQLRWHQNTGFLPLGIAGIYKEILHLSNHPILRLIPENFIPNEQTKIMVAAPQNQLRRIIDEVMEAFFANSLSPKDTLNNAASRSNHILQRFYKNTH